jgi:hypothetical protein
LKTYADSSFIVALYLLQFTLDDRQSALAEAAGLMVKP